MDCRWTGTWNTLLVLVGVALWVFLFLGIFAAFQLPGAGFYLGATLLCLYLVHPWRRKKEELDDKLPQERWDEALENYFNEVMTREEEEPQD